MEQSYGIGEFLEIVKTLRSEGGCPWDREQTHDSLRPCVMEEAAELEAAIRIYKQTQSAENMKEELGDLLLQVVMHSRIAEEEGLFAWADVVQVISEKMIRRHPHVFGNGEAADTAQVLKNWEEIKKKEKEGLKWIPSPLREVPIELPALARAPKILKKIDQLYCRGNNFQISVNKLEESLERLKLMAKDFDKTEENTTHVLGNELGDMLLEISNLARIGKISQEQILSDKLDDLIQIHEG